MAVDLVHRCLRLDCALPQDLWLAYILFEKCPSIAIIDEVFDLQRSVFIILAGLLLNDLRVNTLRPNLLKPLDLLYWELFVFN